MARAYHDMELKEQAIQILASAPQTISYSQRGLLQWYRREITMEIGWKNNSSTLRKVNIIDRLLEASKGVIK